MSETVRNNGQRQMKITFEPQGKTVKAFPEHTILDVAHSAGVDIVATCGGNGRCKSCRIRIIEGDYTPPTAQEINVLGKHDLNEGFRLACQTKALGDAVIRIAPPLSERSFRILSHTEKQHYVVAPDVCKQHLQLPHITEEQQSSDFEDIQKWLASPAVAGTGGDGIHHIDFRTLQQLPSTMYQTSRDVTVVKWNRQLISIEAGDTTDRLYGIAFDIGTTTVVGYLLDLGTGKEVTVASAVNAQTLYGGDVMSRITFAQQNGTGLQKLHTKIISTMNNIIDTLCDQSGVDRQQIYEVTIVGNTCMHHLLLSIAPVHLGVAPYLAAIRKQYVVTASELGINVFPQARVVMLPLIAGFVGADTVGVILATGMHRSKEITLAVDIGTNGEIVLGSEHRLIACSTAAGTAFEGAQITHGMRGASGAIDRVVIDGDVHCHVIGDGPVQGICGSGMVDAIAHMLDAGVINAMGRVLSAKEAENKGKSLPPLLQKRLVKHGRQKAFVLVHGDQTGTGEAIVITQQDIRALQLAKGAIAAGISMLLKALHVQEEEITEILLAGAFGNYLDTESAVRIGLIPDILHEKIRSVGNAAGLGSQLALLSGEAKREADSIAGATEHIALTTNPEFQSTFAEAMKFPESGKLY